MVLSTCFVIQLRIDASVIRLKADLEADAVNGGCVDGALCPRDLAVVRRIKLGKWNSRHNTIAVVGWIRVWCTSLRCVEVGPPRVARSIRKGQLVEITDPVLESVVGGALTANADAIHVAQRVGWSDGWTTNNDESTVFKLDCTTKFSARVLCIFGESPV
eukprot:SAG31_NODE_2057_length_6542_cov_2.889182_4_plen_160_part_00